MKLYQSSIMETMSLENNKASSLKELLGNVDNILGTSIPFDYSNAVKSIIDLGIVVLSNNKLALAGKVVSKLEPLLVGTVNKLKDNISELKAKENKLRGVCSLSKISDGIKLRENKSISSKQIVNISKNVVSIMNTKKVGEIKSFFNNLSFKMNNIKNKKMLEGKKNDTPRGLPSADGISIENAELNSLKDFRDNLMSEEVEKETSKLPEHAPRVLTPFSGNKFNQWGYTSEASLLVFIGILFTIVEFAMIYFKIVVK